MGCFFFYPTLNQNWLDTDRREVTTIRGQVSKTGGILYWRRRSALTSIWTDQQEILQTQTVKEKQQNTRIWGGGGPAARSVVGPSARSSPRSNLTTTNGIGRHLPADQCPNRLPNRLWMLPKHENHQGRAHDRICRVKEDIRQSSPPLWAYCLGWAVPHRCFYCGCPRFGNTGGSAQQRPISSCRGWRRGIAEREENPQLVNEPVLKIVVRLENNIMNLFGTIKRARPCSSMSRTKFSIGLGGRGVKALCGRATSWGQSSTEGTPTTLQGWVQLSGIHKHRYQNHWCCFWQVKFWLGVSVHPRSTAHLRIPAEGTEPGKDPKVGTRKTGITAYWTDVSCGCRRKQSSSVLTLYCCK